MVYDGPFRRIHQGPLNGSPMALVNVSGIYCTISVTLRVFDNEPDVPVIVRA